MAPARFRHLEGANEWPGLGTVRPFELQVEHSPYLWTADCTIHLCRVPWDPTYRDIVAWSSAAERDAWFDAHSERDFQFDTEFHVLPGEEVRLPIPFEVLNNFNFLYITWPEPPVEYASEGAVRFFYFVDDVAFVSPSATACRIVLDEWTTHQHDVDLAYIELERGHAPMAAVSADEFLANPIRHMRYLAEPDEATGAPASRIRFTAEDILNGGPQLCVIVMSCDPSQDMGQMYEPGWRTTTSSSMTTQGALGYAVFAVEPLDVDDMLTAIDATAPQAKPSIIGVFLVPRRLVRITAEVSFFGRQAYLLDGAPTVDSLFVLSVDKFGYPAEYRDIAKLYTAPYAAIELTDEHGQTSMIRVEDTTGRLQLSVAASIVMPMIGIDAHIIGIGTDAGADVTWRNLADHSFPAWGDWGRVLRHWDLPTFAVLQDVTIQDDFARFWGRQAQQSAIDSSFALQNANAAATFEMAEETAARKTARLQTAQAANRQQLETSIAADGEIQGADLAKMRNDLNVDTSYALALNVLDIDGIALAASQAEATGEQAIQGAQISVASSHLAHAQAGADVAWSIVDAGIDLTAAASTGGIIQSGGEGGISLGAPGIGIAQQASASAHSVANAAFSAGQATYDSQLASLSLEGAKLSQVQARASYAFQASKSNEATSASLSQMRQKVGAAEERLAAGYRVTHQMQRSSLATQQGADSSINAGDNALALSQAARVRDLSYLASETSKDLQEQGIEAGRRAAALGTPRVIQGGSGRSTDITRPKGIWARIVTQDEGSIAVAGDAMLRYGYRYGGGEWPLGDLTLMPRFTYWQGRARLRGDGHFNMTTRRVIEDIFAAGTTAWRRPEDIGASIYDNREG